MNILNEIDKLKKDKNAIILAHYYQSDEVQSIADEVGDSFYLSKIAKNCDQDTIVFCGVKFMAESAKILSPHKRILLPENKALCPMAGMVNVENIIELKKVYPKAIVICYINSTAEVKSVSDICCTSSNAVNIVKSVDAKQIIFLPDKNLGQYVQEQVPNKEIILWNGFCHVHDRVVDRNIESIKKIYEDAVVLVHPECRKEVRDKADFIGSTGQIINYFKQTSFSKYVIVTEKGVLFEMKKYSGSKTIIPIEEMKCINMKRTTQKSVYNSLKYMQYEVKLDKNVITKAKLALENMLKLGR